MKIRLIVSVCISLIFAVPLVQGETHERIARLLPNDVALYASIHSPRDVVDKLVSFAEIDLPTLEEAADLLLLTDALDGTRKKFDSSSLGVEVLNADSIHLAVLNCENEIGDFVVVIDKGRQDFELQEDVCKLIFRFVAQVLNNGLPNNAYSGQLQEVMSKWESMLAVSSQGQWVVIASKKTLALELLNQVSSDQFPTENLAASRRFQASASTLLEGGFLNLFVSPNHARWLAIAVDFESETVWDRKKRNEIPWVSSSFQVRLNDGSMVVDKKTVVAATLPLAGENKYWEFYKPIKQFPVLWDDVHSVLGKHVDLIAWNALAKAELDSVYGSGTFARYNNNAVSAFRTGLSRPKLGDLSFSLMDFDGSKNLRLFRIAEDADADEIMGYLDVYFPELQRNLVLGGYDVNYAKTNFQGMECWWSKPIQNDGVPKEQGDGAMVLDGWVAIGTFAQLKQVADLESGQVRFPEENALQNIVSASAERMGFENMPHEFGYYRSNIVSGELRGYTSRLLQRVFPNGWQISQKTREQGLLDDDVKRKMTRPQLLALYFTGIVDAYAKHQLEYLKIDGLSTDRSRFEAGETLKMTRKPPE